MRCHIIGTAIVLKSENMYSLYATTYKIEMKIYGDKMLHFLFNLLTKSHNFSEQNNQSFILLHSKLPVHCESEIRSRNP